MSISDVGRVVGDWLFQSAGYNVTLTRLTDRSGLGNHLVRTGTAPTYATHSSIDGMVMGVANTRFSAPSFMPPMFTMLAMIHAELDAADGVALLLARPESYSGAGADGSAAFASGDPAWEDPDLTANYFDTAAKLTRVALIGSDNTVRPFTYSSGFIEASKAYTTGAWQVVQAVLSPADLLLKVRVNKGTITTAAIPEPLFATVPAETVYVDKRTTGITTTGGKHVTLARMAVFNGDVFTDNLSGLNDFVDAVLVNPAI